MNIYESITAIMGEGYAITKDKKNQQQGFRYRGIDDVMNTFFPLLSKHKVFCVPEVLECTREERQTNKGNNLIYSILKTKYTFYAEDGSSISAVVVGEGMDSGDKASNKALAIGMKYAMFQVFCIPTEEMIDPDATTPEPSKPKETYAEKNAEAGQVETCADCGRMILTVFDGDQVKKTASEIAEGSRRYFGRPLCYECSMAETKLKSARQKAAEAKAQ